MGEKVNTPASEKGVITARVEYLDAPSMFKVEYIAADGRFVDGWFYACQLTKA